MPVKNALSIACLVMASVLEAPAVAQPTTASDAQLTLTDPSAIAAANSLGKAIDVVTSKVSECVAAKAALPQLCACRFPAEVKRLRAEYEAALVKFPEWKTKLLNWSPGQGQSRTVSMPGLARQLRQDCPG